MVQCSRVGEILKPIFEVYWENPGVLREGAVVRDALNAIIRAVQLMFFLRSEVAVAVSLRPPVPSALRRMPNKDRFSPSGLRPLERAVCQAHGSLLWLRPFGR